MSHVTTVASNEKFNSWRLKTNELIALINTTLVGNPTIIHTLKELLDYVSSAGVISGCSISDNLDGTVDTAAGEALLRSGTTHLYEIVSAEIPATVGVTLVDNEINYVYAEYNAGSPQVLSTTNVSIINGHDKVLIAVISREGTDLTILDSQLSSVDTATHLNDMLVETEGFKHVIGGSGLSEVGTRNFKILAGSFYRGLIKHAHPEIDTSVAGTFEYYYSNGLGGWTEVVAQTQIDNLNYDDGSGTLAALTASYYGVHWVYLKMGTNKVETYVLYGVGDYATLADAQAETQPAELPGALGDLGVLIGRIIIQQGAGVFALVETPFGGAFNAGAPGNHNSLSSLQGGSVSERYHMTATEHNNTLNHLTDTNNPHGVTAEQIGAADIGLIIALGG